MFEEILKEIEVRMNTLEKGQISLEESVKIYEESMTLIKKAENSLKEMEGKIEVLMDDGSKKEFDAKDA